ncbi:hypothetical protein CRUP_036885, partial [Coryphaenoides rupestris]
MLQALLLPGHARLRSQVDQVLDPALLRQEAEHGALDLQGLAAFVTSTMAALCAPARDPEIRALRRLSDPVDLFREVLRVLELMKKDMVNFTLSSLRPHLLQQAVHYERTKFQQLLDQQPAGCSCAQQGALVLSKVLLCSAGCSCAQQGALVLSWVLLCSARCSCAQLGALVLSKVLLCSAKVLLCSAGCCCAQQGALVLSKVLLCSAGCSCAQLGALVLSRVLLCSARCSSSVSNLVPSSPPSSSSSFPIRFSDQHHRLAARRQDQEKRARRASGSWFLRSDSDAGGGPGRQPSASSPGLPGSAAVGPPGNTHGADGQGPPDALGLKLDLLALQAAVLLLTGGQCGSAVLSLPGFVGKLKQTTARPAGGQSGT